MAARRTRLKGRATPQSTGKRVKRGTATTQAKKNAATPTGRAKITKRLPRGKPSPKQTALVKSLSEQTALARARKTKAGTNRKKAPKDEYDFDETDDFISENSLLSVSFSTDGPRKASNVKSSNLVNQQKGKQKNAHIRCVRQEGNKKKTSTPCVRQEGNKKKTSTPVSELNDSAPKQQQKKSQRKRQQYLQVSVPKLYFDVSVTPILPISADQSLETRSSFRQKTRKGADTKSVSFEDGLMESIPSHTPAGKINRKKTQRQNVVEDDTPSSSVSGDFKEPAPVSSSVTDSCCPDLKKTNRKRKGPDTNTSAKFSKTETASTPAKRPRTNLPKTKQTLLTSNANILSPQKKTSSQNKSARKQKTTKQTGLSPTHMTQIRDTLRRRRPVTSTPASQTENDQEKGKRQKGKAAQQTTPPSVYDSGISMGENLSVSEETSSGVAITLPGFMEDEPLQSSIDFLDDFPISVPSSSVSKEASKTAVKEYKPSKTKREKGRYSTSRIDAWASAVNQSLQDVESFELVVE